MEVMSSGIHSQQFSDGDRNSNRKVFVGGLPSKVTEKTLRGHFSQYGPIESATIIREKGVSKGFGFILFLTPHAAQWAVSSTHTLEGQEVSCKFTVSQNLAKLLVQQEKRRKIFIKDLPPAATSRDIELYFSTFGSVERCSINRTTDDGDKRTSIVLFDSPGAVDFLLSNKDIAHSICGQKLQVFACLSKNEIKEHSIKKEEAFKQQLLREFFDEIENRDAGGQQQMVPMIGIKGELDRSKRTPKLAKNGNELSSTNIKSNNTKLDWNSPFISTGALSYQLDEKCGPAIDPANESKESRFKLNENKCLLRSYGKLAKTQPHKYLTSRTIPNFSNAWSIGSEGENPCNTAQQTCHRCTSHPDFKRMATVSTSLCQSCEQNQSDRSKHLDDKENFSFRTNRVTPEFRSRLSDTSRQDL